VIRVDRFGNLITNIDRRTFGRTLKQSGATVQIRGRELTAVVATYADVRPGELCALFGSTGHLEIAMSRGSAARELAAERGAAVRVRSGA
jgi:S-adenosylmethionine hydrolase